MLIDEVTIEIEGGKGGDGAVHFYPRKQGPDGGDGGNGGNVYARINTNLSNLNKYWEKKDYKAPNGQPGGAYRRKGESGEDLMLDFPPGTSFINLDTNIEKELLPGEPLLLARGGYGGRGNDAFKSSTHQVPREFEEGQPGQIRHYKVIMRLIADYGLIGLPNAGKSSLLNELTRANVKTAPYPFTTLEPNLGACDGKILADVPGLIEGAATGKGLGTKFLKHIEKVTLLLHCIAGDSEDIEKDYQTVRKELEGFKRNLAEKPFIILLTKHDLLDNKQIEEKVKILKKYSPTVLTVSIHDWDSIQKLREFLASSK